MRGFYRGTPENADYQHTGTVEYIDEMSTDLPLALVDKDGDRLFGWNYSGGGPHALATAILKHNLGAEPSTDAVFLFRDRVIARLPRGEWALTTGQVFAELTKIGRDLVKASKGRKS